MPCIRLAISKENYQFGEVVLQASGHVCSMSRYISCQGVAGELIDFCDVLYPVIALRFQKRELLLPVKCKIHRNHTLEFSFLFQAKHTQL